MSAPEPPRHNLDQYRTRAKELLKLARAGDTQALERFRARHPEHERSPSGAPTLADAQLVIARELGYTSWPRLKADLLYLDAVRAIDTGDTARLVRLLDASPRLVHARRRRGEWYEAAYFAGAMLLHHVAGNPIRHPMSANAPEVAKILVDRGADPNARTDGGCTTVDLVLTGKQPSDSGLALPLIDLLREAGARCDLDAGDLLTGPLLNAAPATAEALVRRGARMDLRHASALGRLDAMDSMLALQPDQHLLDEALAFACVRGQEQAARLLLHHGARGDVLVRPGGRSPCTALHEAANRGYAHLVHLLLDHGADPTVVEPHWGGTPAGWARHGGHHDLAVLLEADGGRR